MDRTAQRPGPPCRYPGSGQMPGAIPLKSGLERHRRRAESHAAVAALGGRSQSKESLLYGRLLRHGNASWLTTRAASASSPWPYGRSPEYDARDMNLVVRMVMQRMICTAGPVLLSRFLRVSSIGLGGSTSRRTRRSKRRRLLGKSEYRRTSARSQLGVHHRTPEGEVQNHWQLRVLSFLKRP